jgi:hypothetical protein
MIYRTLVSNEPNIQNNLIQIGSSILKDINIPFNSNSKYSWAGFIYTTFEVGNKGIVGNDEKSKIITGVDIYHMDTTSLNLSNQNIYLAHVTEFQFNTTPLIDLSDLNITDLTLCKSSFTSTPVNNKWNTYNFDTNFYYNGVKNLLLIWENRSGVIGGSSSSYYTFTKNAAAYSVNNTNFPSGNAIRNNNRINIKLRF